MNVYSLYDEQFDLFSDPFLAADHVAAERVLVQTALISDELRNRVSFYCLYFIGTFASDSKWDVMPLKSRRSPKIVCSGRRLSDLVNQCLSARNAHLTSVSDSDFEIKEDSEIE